MVKQCCATDGVEPQYIKDEILPHFFKHFWNHRMALDKRNYRQLVDTTVEIANKVGASEIVNRIVDDLKDENETYRKMVVETIEKIMANLGAADIDSRLEEQLIDGILYAFQEQTTEVCLIKNNMSLIIKECILICYSFCFLRLGRCPPEWIRNHSQSIRQTGETLLASNLRDNIVATEQQRCKNQTASCGFNFKNCCRNENMQRRKTNGTFRRRPLRVFG